MSVLWFKVEISTSSTLVETRSPKDEIWQPVIRSRALLQVVSSAYLHCVHASFVLTAHDFIICIANLAPWLWVIKVKQWAFLSLSSQQLTFRSCHTQHTKDKLCLRKESGQLDAQSITRRAPAYYHKCWNPQRSIHSNDWQNLKSSNFSLLFAAQPFWTKRKRRDHLP